MRATIAILLVLLGAGCEKRGRTRNSSASALFEEGAVATTSVYRFTSVDRSLEDARKAVKEERWADAVAASAALLEKQPGNVEAEAMNAQARLEGPMQARFNDLEKAANGGDVAAAVRHYHALDAASLYRERAKPTLEKLEPAFVEDQLAQTRALNRAGRCDEARRVAKKTAEWFPDARDRLEDAAAGCRGAKPELARAEPPKPAMAPIGMAAHAPKAEAIGVAPPAGPAPDRTLSAIAPAKPVAAAAPIPILISAPAARPLPGAAAPTTGGAFGTVATPPPAVPDAQRKQMLRDYLQERVQPRIHKFFSYPREAERDDIEGTVGLQLTIDGTGNLVAAKIAGACPAPSLCQAALATARASSPFSAPPALLGGQVSVIVRIVYVVER